MLELERSSNKWRKSNQTQNKLQNHLFLFVWFRPKKKKATTTIRRRRFCIPIQSPSQCYPSQRLSVCLPGVSGMSVVSISSVFPSASLSSLFVCLSCLPVCNNKAGYTATSCGRVGRGGNARFPTFQLERDGPTDRPTDRPTDGQSLI